MSALATPPPASGGDSFESGLGAALSEAYDSAVGTSDAPSDDGGTPAPEGADVSPDETEWVGEAPTGTVTPETQPPAQAQPQQPAQPAQKTAADPYPLSPDGKAYMVPKAELSQLGTVRQYFDGVSRFFQNADAAANAYQRSSDLQMMENDWTNGSDASIDAMLNHWAGANYTDNPVMQQRFQTSFAKMAERAPQVLKATNPTAYRSMLGNIAKFSGTIGADGQIQWGGATSPASGLMLDAVNMAYEQAAQTGSPFDLRRAQEVDFAITGTYKEELPKLDPQAEEKAKFERDQATFRQQQDKMAAGVTNSWNSQNVEGAKFRALGQAIDQQLATWKQKSGVSDAFYNDIKAGLVRDLVGDFRNGRMGGQIAQMDPEWTVLHEQEFRAMVNEFRQGWQNDPQGQRLQARVEPYIQSFISRAKRLIPALAKARIEARKPSAPAPARKPAAAPAGTPPNPAPGTRISRDDWDTQWNGFWDGVRAS